MSTSGGIGVSNAIAQLMGGVYNATPPTGTDGQPGVAQLDQRLNLRVALMGNNGAIGGVFTTGGDSYISSINRLFTIAEQMQWNGSSSDRVRTPNTFKYASRSALGASNIWTPAAGKKFRLMGYVLHVTHDASLAVAGNVALQLTDNGTPFAQIWALDLPAAAGVVFNGGFISGVVQLGNGYLSAAANNPLQLAIPTALATGLCQVTVWGTEE